MYSWERKQEIILPRKGNTKGKVRRHDKIHASKNNNIKTNLTEYTNIKKKEQQNMHEREEQNTKIIKSMFKSNK